MKVKAVNNLNWWATGLNLVIIMGLLNLAVMALLPSARLDLTKNKLHTLSDGSVKTIKELKDLVTIKAYITKDLPPEVKPLGNDLKMILGEFEALNNSKVKVEYLDPNSSKEIEQEAMKYGIQPLQFSTVKTDKFELSNGYFGLALIYGNKQEVLPVAGDVGNVEYFLISGIKKLIGEGGSKILLVEDGAQETLGGMTIFQKYVGSNYQLETVKLGDESSLTNKNGILVVIGAQESWAPTAISQFEGWVKNKKPVLMMVDKVKVDNNLIGKLVNPIGFENVLKSVGIEIESNLVMDTSSAIASFRSQSGGFLTQYPFWVEVRPENINQSLPALSGIQTMLLPWVSSLVIQDGVQNIISSSQQSWVIDEVANLSPTEKITPGDEVGKKVLGALVTDKALMAVVGDADMISDQFVSNNQQNLAVVLNLIDYLGADESMLDLRTKIIDNPPLVVLTDQMKQVVRWVNVFSPLIGLMVIALASMLIRKRSNRYDLG